MAHDIFISYSSKDKATVDMICSQIESRGMKCWYAPRDIEPGANWAASINDAISGAKVMVLVFTEFADQSEQVLREVGLAVEKGLTIIPFRLTAKKPSDAFRYYLRSFHWLDALDTDEDRAIDELARQCELNIHSSIETSRVYEKKNRWGTGKKIAVAGVCIASLAFIVLVLLTFLGFLDSSLRKDLTCVMDGPGISKEMFEENFIRNMNGIDAGNDYTADYAYEHGYQILRNGENTGLMLCFDKRSDADNEFDCAYIIADPESKDAMTDNRRLLAETLYKTAYPDITEEQMEQLMAETKIDVNDLKTYLDIGDYYFEYRLYSKNGKPYMALGRDSTYAGNFDGKLD